MSPAALASYVRRKTHTDTTTYPNADLLADANVFMEEIASALQMKRRDVWHMPATMNLEADRREYILPENLLNGIESVELKLEDEYVYATPLKGRPKIALTETEITNAYDNSEPYYFMRRDSLYILSGTITAVTAGIRLIKNQPPEPISDITSSTDLSTAPSTTTLGFPSEFHTLLARRIIQNFKDTNDTPLNREDQMYEQDLDKRIEQYSFATESLERRITQPTNLFSNGYDL